MEQLLGIDGDGLSLTSANRLNHFLQKVVAAVCF